MGLTALFRATSNADDMLDHAGAIGGYTSNAERVGQFATTKVPNLPSLQIPQDMSALRIPPLLLQLDIGILFLQIINKTKVSTTL